MLFVYLLTTVISGLWLIKMVKSKTLLIKRTPLDIPILLFLASNILSTIFSIDSHTSIFGYYSRLNGGLLSIICYSLLYFALVANFEKDKAVTLIKIAVWGGAIPAVWAIFEHFGISFSCVLLTGQVNASCWVQDVQARVFSTLGQPNWLASYLAMLIFPSIYFYLTAKQKLFKAIYLLATACYYLAFTFTYSRGTTLGLISGLLIFTLLTVINPKSLFNALVVILAKILSPPVMEKIIGSYNQRLKLDLNLMLLRSLGVIFALFLSINLLFGSSLSQFRLIKQSAPPSRPAITPATLSTDTQLEIGGTESGQIRLIVWRGAWEIFKHYPILGSGVETFAYSYYNFRPKEHNLVSEWDFLYNKAHNEYLNYLANTGLVGFTAYMFFILSFIIWNKKVILTRLKFKNSSLYIFSLALLSSYIGYLVQNFFGFSVVMVAIFFYLYPAIAFILAEDAKPIQITPLAILKSSLFSKLSTFIIISLTFLFLFQIVKLWLADYYFNQGSNANEAGNPGKAYNRFTDAIRLNPGEPLYHSELAFAAAGAAVALEESDATLSGQLKSQTLLETEKLIKNHPKNASLFRTAVRTFYLLSTKDQTFTAKALETLNQTIALSPTDAKLYYNKAIILGAEGKNSEAIETLEKTVKLKPNYRDAYYALGIFYFQDGQKERAIETMKTVLKLAPSDLEASEKLKTWQ